MAPSAIDQLQARDLGSGSSSTPQSSWRRIRPVIRKRAGGEHKGRRRPLDLAWTVERAEARRVARVLLFHEGQELRIKAWVANQRGSI
jgi:hypothetical protein